MYYNFKKHKISYGFTVKNIKWIRWDTAETLKLLSSYAEHQHFSNSNEFRELKSIRHETIWKSFVALAFVLLWTTRQSHQHTIIPFWTSDFGREQSELRVNEQQIRSESHCHKKGVSTFINIRAFFWWLLSFQSNPLINAQRHLEMFGNLILKLRSRSHIVILFTKLILSYI